MIKGFCRRGAKNAEKSQKQRLCVLCAFVFPSIGFCFLNDFRSTLNSYVYALFALVLSASRMLTRCNGNSSGNNLLIADPRFLVRRAPYVTTLSLVLTKPRYNARTKFLRALFAFLKIF
jgi:hypothetical protein